MINNGLKNAAYSEKYREESMRYESLFLEENRKDSEEILLADGYKIEKTNYEGHIDNRNLHGHYCVLLDKGNNMIHYWKSFDNDADFEKIITHSNKKSYLLYRQELYGYSVFDLTNNECFQYYPQCVLDGREYFIWTDVHYNSLNNLLAVTGCIWGAPWSTLLVDFSVPMAAPKYQVDVIDCLSGGYDVYDDADFVRWDGECLVLNCYNTQTNLKEEITPSPEIYYQKINSLQ